MLYHEFIDPVHQIETAQFKFIESFLNKTGRTQQIGWHYITDLSWIISHAEIWPNDFKILDAGGGKGPLQFLLTEMGHHITNIDLSLSKPEMAPYTGRDQMTYRIFPSFRNSNYLDFISREKTLSSAIKNLIKISFFYKIWSARRYAILQEKWKDQTLLKNTRIGHLNWIKGNLCNMPEIPDNYFDAIVSLSALEHIPTDDLPAALSEINRVLKPGAPWAVTTSATDKPETWFHEPSRGYCFSTKDLEAMFKTSPALLQSATEILKHYLDCTYLKNNLPKVYFESGNNGMPWGKWDPQYISVGIFRQISRTDI